jgi:hypothetical protein
MTLTAVLAERVAQRMRRDGFNRCTQDDVHEVWNTGTLERDDALASAILQEFEELGIEVPA